MKIPMHYTIIFSSHQMLRVTACFALEFFASALAAWCERVMLTNFLLRNVFVSFLLRRAIFVFFRWKRRVRDPDALGAQERHDFVPKSHLLRLC